jgi:hypothetical protein
MAPLGIKSLALFRRHERAHFIAAAESPVANAGYEIIDKVARRAGNYRQRVAERFQSATKAAQNMHEGVRARQQAAVAGKNHDAVGQAGLLDGGYPGRERLSMKRREPKGVAGAIVLQNKFHGAVAQRAVAIIEEHFGAGRSGRHSAKSIARPLMPSVPGDQRTESAAGQNFAESLSYKVSTHVVEEKRDRRSL